VREARLAFGDTMNRLAFRLSSVALLPTERAASAAHVFYDEIQPVTAAATDEWRLFSRLNLVFLFTHDQVGEAFAESYPDVMRHTDKKAFAFRAPRANGASVFILSGIDATAVEEVIRAVARQPSLAPSGLLVALD
jgi:hypothetical protein